MGLSHRIRALVMLTLVSAIWIYAVLVQDPAGEKICAVSLGGAAMLSLFLTPFRERHTGLGRGLLTGTSLLLLYVWSQTISLPIAFVRLASPARAAIQDALEPLMPGAGAATSLSVNPEVTQAFLIRLMAYVALFWITYRLSSERSSSPWIIALPVMAAGVVEGLLGIIQYVTGPSGEVAHGTYENRNHFAGLMEMTLPFLIMGAVSMLNGLRGPGKFRMLLPASPYLLGSASVVAAACFSLSRTGVVLVLLSLVVLTAVAAVRFRLSRTQWLGLCGGVLVAIPLVVILAPGRLVDRFAQLPGSGEDRRLLWSQALNVIADFPWTGCGLGAYRDIWMSHKTSMPLWETDFVHNDYLQLLAEFGVVGCLIGLAMLAMIAICAVRARRHRDLAIAGAVSLAAILLHSLDDFNLYIPANAMLVAWVAGMIAGLERRQFSASPAFSPSPPERTTP